MNTYINIIFNLRKRILSIILFILLSIITSSYVSAQAIDPLLPDPGTAGGGEVPCKLLTEEGLSDDAAPGGKCRCGVKMATHIPGIGDCLRKDNDFLRGAFPLLLGSLIRILISLIFIAAIIVTLTGSVLMIAGGAKESWFSQGRSLIYKVALGITVLGLSGLILRVVNPNFFGPQDRTVGSGAENVQQQEGARSISGGGGGGSSGGR